MEDHKEFAAKISQEISPKLENSPSPHKPAEPFYRVGSHGLVEAVDPVTGAIVAIQESMEILPPADFVEHTMDGKTYLVQNSVDISRLSGIKKKIPFSPVLADLICEKIVGGVGISELSKVPGFPDLHTIARWRASNEDFDVAIRQARRVRAELMRDLAMRAAEGADGELAELVAGKRLFVDTLKWAAEKDDPETYSTRTKVDATVAAVTMIVDTGIRRHGDEGAEKEIIGEVVDPRNESVRGGDNPYVVEGACGDASGDNSGGDLEPGAKDA